MLLYTQICANNAQTVISTWKILFEGTNVVKNIHLLIASYSQLLECQDSLLFAAFGMPRYENMGGPGGEAPRKKQNSDPQIKIFEIFSQDPIFEWGVS